MATFVLVHGAFHGGACWQRLTPLLERAGHRVLAPDLPASGHDGSSPAEARLSSYAGRIAAIIDTLTESPILVGHDLGSVVCTQVAEHRAWRVAGTVHVAGLLLRSGETPQSLIDEQAALGPDDPLRTHLRRSVDGQLLELVTSAAREVCFHRCGFEDAVRAARELTRQPAAVYHDPTLLTNEAWGRVPRWYVECTDDRAMPVEWQRRMVERVPVRQVYEIDSDHAPFLSAPVELAQALLQIAEQLAATARPTAPATRATAQAAAAR